MRQVDVAPEREDVEHDFLTENAFDLGRGLVDSLDVSSGGGQGLEVLVADRASALVEWEGKDAKGF